MDFRGSHKEVRGRCPRSPAKQRRHGIATRERRSPRHFWGYFCAAAGQAFACHAQIRHRKTPQSVPADATRSWATSAEDSDPVHTSGSRSSSCGRAHDNKRVCSRHSHNSRPRSSGAIKGDMYGLILARGSTRAVYCLLARPPRGSVKDPRSEAVVGKRPPVKDSTANTKKPQWAYFWWWWSGY